MCEFCEMYMVAKEYAEETACRHGIDTDFKVIFAEIKTKGRRRKGMTCSMPMELVYCPQCGKKLSELE